jgi:tetratricopeptide (TPR) repeat protein
MRVVRTIAEENSMLGAYNWKIPRGDESETVLQGYVRPQYAKPGYTVSFHASSELDNCQFFLRIYRLGWYKGAGARQVHRSKITSVGNHGIWSKQKGWQQKEKFGDAVNGMNWPRVYQLYIPEDWLSGSYIAKFETLDGKSYIHPFWISTIGKTPAKIAVLGSVITSQARNWWGGVSATKVIGGSAFTSDELYYPVGSEILSFERPYFNSRGGDALRWEYPLVRWIEKNQLDVAYHTDLELETDPELLSNYSHVITAGPMRYWTNKTESALENYVNFGGNIVHLGSEAGQHIVKLRNHNDYHDGQIILQPNEDYPNIGERLENNFYSTKVSGSRKKAPWANLQFLPNLTKVFPDLDIKTSEIDGIAGLSWDKSIKSKDVQIVASSRIKHRRWTYRITNSHIKKFPSGGTIFNAGVSSWSWGLEKFGNHGNAIVSKELQKITLRLIDWELEPDVEILDYQPIEEIDSYDDFTLEDFNIILKVNPRHFDALLGAGIYLWEQEEFNDAHTYFERALQVNPNSVMGIYRLARNHHKLQQYEEMLSLYEFLLKEHPERDHYRLQYGDLMINLERYEEAEEYIQQYLERRKDDPKGWGALAHCYRKAKKLQLAEKYCNQALQMNPKHRQSLVNSARIAHDQGDYFLAAERWGLVLKIEPENYPALMGIARACIKRGDHQRGQDMLQELIHSERHKNRIWPYVDLINMAFNYLNDYEYTVKLCQSLFDNVGASIQNYKYLEHIPVCHLGLCLSKIGKHKEARKIITRYMMENPENSEYRLALSQVSREAGDTVAAFSHFTTLYDESEFSLCTFKSKGAIQQISVEYLDRDKGKDVIDGPLVSVVMTAFKATELIDVAINSILNQTYRNIELIVVDDASPDDTFEHIKKLAKKDSRIRPIRLEMNGGTYVAKNHGLLNAVGEYVTFHDSDDWCHPDKIRVQVESLERNRELKGITSGYIRVDENSNIIYRGKGSLRHACISLMIRREEVIDRIGFFDSVRVSADSEFERRIHAVFGKETVAHIDLPLIIANVSSESLSGGGKFALDWTGLSGPRLQYRQQFEQYHDRIRIGTEKGYVPFPLINRVFDAPREMIW